MDNEIDLPYEFLTRLPRIVPESQYQGIISAFSADRPTTFRVNTLKSTADELLDSLEKQGFGMERVPWYTDAFILTKGTQRMLTETAEYSNGHLYVQSLSSMIPPLILDAKAGEKILDISAAPGSKTTQMASAMNNEGEIIANDTSQIRLYRLKANLETQGVTNVRVHKSDARSIWQGFPEYFDKTLADVPCSMEGRFKMGAAKSYEEWSMKKVKDLAHLQRWILRSAISSTRPGGMIVYSTCTLSPEENEEVIDWILDKEKGAVVLEDIARTDIPFAPSLHSWGAKSYHGSIGYAARLYPSRNLEGFFIAKLRKIRSTLPNAVKR